MSAAFGVPLYPHPCGVCGAPARQPCKLQRRVFGGIVGTVECDGSDRPAP